MGIRHDTDFAEDAFRHLQTLTDLGAYPSISDAASALVLRDKKRSDGERAALEKEVLRRMELPDDQWIPVRAEGFLEEAIARFEARIAASKK